MTIVRALAPFARTKVGAHPGMAERCGICAAALGVAHAHVLDRSKHAVACACTACATVFADARGMGVRYRRIPDRVLVDPAPDRDTWTALGIPVGLAFVVCDEARTSAVAILPSPAGPVRSELRDEAWRGLMDSSPLARALEPEVEALLVRRSKDGRFDCFLAPIDACFALVGDVRRSWRGFDGGDEARRAIDACVHALAARAKEVGR